MKLAFVVNRIETEQADYTTIRLARKAAARGHELAFFGLAAVSYTHLRAHETPEHLVCRLLLEKKN